MAMASAELLTNYLSTTTDIRSAFSAVVERIPNGMLPIETLNWIAFFLILWIHCDDTLTIHILMVESPL